MASSPTPELDPRFSSSDAHPTPWAEAEAVLAAGPMFWLSTVRPDGRPHTAPLPAMWLDGALHLATGETEQKHRNLGREPRCTLTTGTNAYGGGLDVVVEGIASIQRDEGVLRRLATMWLERLQWSFEVRDGAFHDPATVIGGTQLDGAASADVFAVRPTKVLAFHKGGPPSQTRYRFT